MSIKLNIPTQEKPDRDSFPTAPRRVRRWLRELASSNLSDNTRELFRGLQHSNRLANSSKDRIEIMEMFRPHLRMVLEQLGKRFIGVGLPLPSKTRRVFELNLAMLQAMATGYKIAVCDAVDGRSRLSSRAQAMASERAMRYLNEIMLRASQVYAPLPQGLWQDLHQLYVNVEIQDRLGYEVKDPELRQRSKSSVLSSYKHALLFALARPESLRRGEAQKVFDTLEIWADRCSLSPAPSQLPEFPVFVVDLTGYGGPTIPAYLRSGLGPSTRVVDVRPVLNAIRERLAEAGDDEGTLALDRTLAVGTLRRMETNLSLSAARNSKRAKREAEATVEVGLRHIHAQVVAELDAEDGDEDIDYNLTLQAIPSSERRDPSMSSGDYITHPSYQDMRDEPSIWDVVGTGNVLTRAYREELQRRAKDRYKVRAPSNKQEWKLVDISSGGFGLRWQGEGSAKAHVGEVVGLREVQRGNYAQWRIGVIRWMRFVGDNSFDAGVQTLSPHGIAVQVGRMHSARHDAATDCLVLPEIKAVGQSTSLLTPAHMFKVGDVVRLRIFDKDLEVRLSNVVEHTGSFTQFQIVPARPPQGQAVSATGEFEKVWADI